MEQSGSYGTNSIITFLAGILNLALGTFVSVIIARSLGPEGKGVYTVATLFSHLVVTLGSLGLPSAATFYVAKRSYTRQEILGNTVLVGLLTGFLGMIVGSIIVIFAGQYILPGISQEYLMLAILAIPGNMLLIHLQHILLGAQHIKEYNIVTLIQSFFLLTLITLFLWIFKMGVFGALAATILSWIFTSIFTFMLVIKINNGIELKINFSYLKNALKYGHNIYIATILRLLSLRVNLFLTNAFLDPTSVGLYSISVGLAEKLWLISHAAATVLFPKIVMEEDKVRKEFTPIVARTVLWIMILTAFIIFLSSQWLISFLYSQTFLPAATPLKILLLGTVSVGLSQILGNDIAGRGRPILNVYANIVSFVSITVLSILWIPKYGIKGAAWASTVSYIFNLTVIIPLYAQISGNSLRTVILPKSTDWILYWKIGKILWQWIGMRTRIIKAIR